MTKEELVAAIDRAVDTFTYDLGFTAPELFPMRIEELRDRLHGIVEGEDE